MKLLSEANSYRNESVRSTAENIKMDCIGAINSFVYNDTNELGANTRNVSQQNKGNSLGSKPNSIRWKTPARDKELLTKIDMID